MLNIFLSIGTINFGDLISIIFINFPFGGKRYDLGTARISHLDFSL